jgi:DNA-binding CsgD family transcriptional regulator/PAS domain-containing protein
LYDAAVDSAAGAGIARILAEVGGGDKGAVVVFGPNHYEALTHEIPDEALTTYAAHFNAIDPWTNHTKDHASNGYLPAVIGRRLVPERELFKSEYFAGFARPFDMIEVVGGSVPIGGGRLAVFSTQRRSHAPRFETSDERRIRRFTPHLQRALQLREHLAGAAQTIGFAALDRLAFGAVVCDASGRVLFANAAAEQMACAGDGVVLGDAATPISALRLAQAQSLLALVHEVCNGGAGGAIAITGATGTRLMALIAPLPPRFGSGPPLALLALRPVAAGAVASAEVLMSLFGLTPAEAALTAALAGGSTLAEIGVARGTSENTLRTQLGNIFRKTGTRNQSDLVRLIATLPPLR